MVGEAALANGCAARRGAGPFGVADGVVVPMRPGNAGGGKDPWSGNGAGRSERQAIDAWRLERRQGSRSSPRHHMRKRRRESSMYRPTGGSAGAESAAVSKLAALWTANGPTSGCAGGTRWAARGLPATPTMSARQSVAPRPFLLRHYPVSAVLRPHPSFAHVVATTPAEPLGAHVALLPQRRRLPRISGGSASALPFSRPAQRSLLVSAYALAESLTDPFPSEASTASLPPRPFRLLPAGTTLAGWDSHPLGPCTFARHTEKCGLVPATGFAERPRGPVVFGPETFIERMADDSMAPRIGRGAYVRPDRRGVGGRAGGCDARAAVCR